MDTLDRCAKPKPAKGSGLIERKTKRKAIVAFEDGEKEAVRKRDIRCRWPNCQNCRSFKPRLEVAHMVPKGMGGDHGERSGREALILLDFLTHQGSDGLECGERKIEPLTSRGTAGPCAFYQKVYSESKKGEWRWKCDGREVAIGVLERY